MEPRLRLTGLKKNIGETALLRSAALVVHPGEIHGLLGESGSGKSSLIKCVAGCWAADGGTMEYDGLEGLPENPREARRYRIEAVLQEPTLIRALTVEQNIFLGREPHRWGWTRWADGREELEKWLGRFGCADIKSTTIVANLSRPQRRIVEIIRALIAKPRLLLLDAPAEGLTGTQAQTLIDVLNELKSAEVAIVYATPHSIECRRVADTCTIMRDGQSVATGDIRPVGDADLFKLMTDREPAELYIRSPRVRGAPVIEIRNLQVGVGTVSFVVHQKEIFGLFGLPGSGRTGLFRSLFGIETPQSGEILIGEIERTGSSPTERWREGIGFLPQGGVDAGILPNRTVSQNLLLTRMDAIGSEWFVRERSERHMALDWMEHTDVRAASDLEIAANLSSGSRRRLAAGRLYYHQSQLFLMDEPCRGVDLTSRTQMYRRMDKAACAGRSFLIGSSNPQELLGICDTIGVMNEGSLAEIRPAREWTEEALWHRAGR